MSNAFFLLTVSLSLCYHFIAATICSSFAQADQVCNRAIYIFYKNLFFVMDLLRLVLGTSTRYLTVTSRLKMKNGFDAHLKYRFIIYSSTDLSDFSLMQPYRNLNQNISYFYLCRLSHRVKWNIYTHIYIYVYMYIHLFSLLQLLQHFHLICSLWLFPYFSIISFLEIELSSKCNILYWALLVALLNLNPKTIWIN